MSENEIKSCLVSSRIEENFKLIRVIGIPDKRYNFKHARQFDSEWIYFGTDRRTCKVPGRKFDCEGNILRYSCGKMRNPSPVWWNDTCCSFLSYSQEG